MLVADCALFTAQSANALQRKLASFEQHGAELLFGEPTLQLEGILRIDRDGRGRIHSGGGNRRIGWACRSGL